MTRHCHQCGTAWTLSGLPGRNDTCPQCGADLKVCLNCVHYDACVAYQCREQRADEVMAKDRSNYCEYFDFARRAWTARPGADARTQAARDQLKKLFGG